MTSRLSPPTTEEPLRAAVADAAAAPPPGGRRPRFSLRTFDSLREREFRWFFFAMLGQMAGMNMQMLVRGYLVFELTDSFAALGVIGLVSAIPIVALSLIGGVIADRAPRKLVLQLGQGANVLIALAVGALLLADLLRFEHLVVASFVQGTVMALMMPSRQAMVTEVVPPSRLMNAVSLNAAGMNLMRLLAPAGGGFVISVFGASWAYMLMAALYLAAIVALLPVPGRPAVERAPTSRGVGSSGAADLVDGLRYVLRDRVMFALVGVSFVTAILAMPYLMMLPGFVSEVLDGGATELGLLMAISGAGSLLGSLAIASLPERRRGLLYLLAVIFLGASLLAFSVSETFAISAAVMVLVGVGTAGRQTLGSVLLQSYVEDRYRGRVMSIWMTQWGMMSGGTLLVGLVAEEVGIQAALGGLAVALIAFTLAVLVLVPRVRRIA
jgi:MFS family permease